jgi:hypothetical protein
MGRDLEAQERFGLVMVTLFEILLGVAIVALVVALLATSGCERVVERDFEVDAHVWDETRIPLMVTSSPELHVDDMRAAVNPWNAGGCKLLDYQGAGDEGDIVIRIGDDDTEDGAGAWLLRFRPEFAQWYGEAVIRKPGDRRMITITAMHELGHLLGLAHDRTQTQSVMHPDAAGREVGYINPTRHDLDALARKYCR